jgi:hypothetical protein
MGFVLNNMRQLRGGIYHNLYDTNTNEDVINTTKQHVKERDL